MMNPARGLVSRMTAMVSLMSLALVSIAACQSRSAFDSSAIARFVLAQVRIDRLGAGLPTPPLGPEGVSIDVIDSSGAVRVYRVTPWILEHWHPYLVAVSDVGMHGLGGFPAPEPCRVFVGGNDQVQNTSQARQIASKLAQLLDPYGGGEISFPADSMKNDELRLAWRRAAREGFLADTVIRGASSHVVRITVLSHLSRQYPMAWQRVTFVFELGHNAELSGWSMRTGRPVYAVDSQ